MRLSNAFRRFVLRRDQSPQEVERGELPEGVEVPAVDIAPNDPIIAYFQSASGAVNVGELELDSPALAALKAADMKVVVPLVSQGELIGLLNLGPRLSEQEYSADDLRLLNNLAGHAATAVRVAQLVRQQQVEVRSRERLEQEMRVAELIQQQFLPRELPELDGWKIGAYYRPARAVGGDFYDFIPLPDGRIGLVVGDVTDKGVPAALVMATTHSIIRGDAPLLMSPSMVLQKANERLYPDIPAHMFVTCLYAVLDPATGHLEYANAGHNLPYVRTQNGVIELRATGMPLGLMPDSSYESKEAILAPGESLLLHSDGLAEAHAPDHEMFGFPRLIQALARCGRFDTLIEQLLGDLDGFTGRGWEQEDDITLVALERNTVTSQPVASADGSRVADRVLADFTLASEPGNERAAMERVAAAAGELLEQARLDRLKTAVAEATMNAIEHGNKNNPELPVAIQVSVSNGDLLVRITDRGGDQSIPEASTPDIEAKLAGEQTPRGWGLFLIRNMVDEMSVSADEVHHTVELVLHLQGDADGN